jgi:dihydrofolate reductase
MTVINKLNQTLEMLKSCESNCNTFSMDTDDVNAKQLYTTLGENIKKCTDSLQSRINYVTSQEPQYQPEDQKAKVNQQAKAMESLNKQPEL